MRKIYMLLLCLIATFSLLAACQSNEQKNTETSEDPIPSSWEEFDGYVVERTEKEGRDMILVVSGITKQNALKMTSKETLSNVPSENAIWFTNLKVSFNDIKKGDNVTVWWDTTKPHNEPAILTLIAEKVVVSED